LKRAANESKLEKIPEITTDHGAPKTIDDLEVGGDYDLGPGPAIYTIRIDSTGTNGAPDTFTWGAGDIFTYHQEKVLITGDWQTLGNGVRVRFPSKSGYSLGSLWFLSYDGAEAYGIRIGHGMQKDYIENVRIFGKGTIDLNNTQNVQPSGLVKNISACVLVHGRVRNVSVEDIAMTDTMRSVMLYGEHTGKFLQGGATGPGESFDAENISIFHTRTINPKGSGYLLGHPSHRGLLHKVRCNYNYMETATTSIEPNFNLSQYEVIGNVIKSGGRAIHCWRKSTDGLIKDNVRIDDTTGKEVVMVNAPGAWQSPENITIRDNRNHLSDRTGFWANVSGGMENRAEGRLSTVIGGQGNEALAEFSTARGARARATRAGEDAHAAGMFKEPGDAQSSRLVLRVITTNREAAKLRVTIPENTSATYRILVVARGEGGSAHASFEATGLAYRNGSAGVQLAGAKLTPIHASDSSIGLQVKADGGHLLLEAQGLAGKTLRWVATVELAEVRF